MKSFLYKILLFCALILSILLTSLFFIPNKIVKNNLLASLPDKHAILEKSRSPKIIFIGGSNVSFGLNSQKIVDTFHRPVINMALNMNIGLKYMLNDLKPYINKGDIVVAAPEYSNYTSNQFIGNTELVTLLFDVYPEGRKYIDLKQWYHLCNFIPTYATTKIKNSIPWIPNETQKLSIVYSRKSFNQYGDSYLHWGMPNEKVTPAKKSTGREELNPDVIPFLKEYQQFVSDRGALFVIMGPAFQASSYNNQQNSITKIESELKKNKLPLISDFQTYKFPDNYFFNSYYHLNKQGVEERTDRVITDLSGIIKATN